MWRRAKVARPSHLVELTMRLASTLRTSRLDARRLAAAAPAAALAVAAAMTVAPGRAAADGGATTGSATTQACLGDFQAFLACPAGARVAGTECRQREPQSGAGEGEHWSGSKRQGPALFMRGNEDAITPKSVVSFAAFYKNHKKNGRVFRFDKEGRLESWNNVVDDEWYGLAVTCTPEGKVAYLATHFGDKTIGVSRSWRVKDGSFSYAIEYDANGKIARHLEATPELARRPDELCRPKVCNVTAPPDLSGAPAGFTAPSPK